MALVKDIRELERIVPDPTRRVASLGRIINVGLLEDEGLEPGDWVLIHVGFAISVIDEEEARTTRELLEAMGAEYEQELTELRASVIE